VSFSLYRRTRSARLVVTTPEGQTIEVDNLVGDSGFSLEFEARRTMDESLGEFSVTAYNLPPEAITVMESAQVRRVDDIDRALVGLQLNTSEISPDGTAALAGGFLVTELMAGYDGTMSRVFRAVGARSSSGYADDDGGQQARDRDGRFVRRLGGLTYRTRIDAMDALDGVLLGLPQASFPAGATFFELVDYLRRIAGLGPGNLTQESLAALIGQSRLTSPYHVSGGQAGEHLRNVLQYLPLRYFFDDREIWICGKDGVPNASGVPAYVTDQVCEPDLLITRTRRDDGGRVRADCLLCPRLLPGRLVRLSEAGLSLALQGLSPTEVELAYAQVPPGLYRLEEVTHTGSTSDMNRWTSSMLLRPGVAANL
jgi:hypothetical protein